MANNTGKPRNPRLHQLIPIKRDLQQQATATRDDLQNTFEKKEHHFTGKLKTFTPFIDDPTNASVASIPRTSDALDIQTTVMAELSWLKPYLVKSLDAHYHVALGNMTAKADVVLEDGGLLMSDVPTSTLLELEDYITGLRGFLAKIPTLDPAKGFTPDPDKGDGIYQARPVDKARTLASKKLYILSPATDKHPAQTQLLDEQIPVGMTHEQEWSSKLTPAMKGAILDRCEVVLRAVRRARAEANEVEVDTSATIGRALIEHIFGV